MDKTIKQQIKYDPLVGDCLLGSYAEIEGRHRQLHALVAGPYEPRYAWERNEKVDWWNVTFESSHGISTFHMRVPRQDLVNWAKKIVAELGDE